MQTVQSCFSYLLIPWTKCCLMGNTDNKLSLLILECSKTPIEINGSSGYIKKITFKTYLHLCSLFSIQSSLAQPVSPHEWLLLFWGFFHLGWGWWQNRTQSRAPCVKWGISQTLLAWNMFWKKKGQSKNVLNFYPLDVSISLEMISVHTETCRGFKLNTQETYSVCSSSFCSHSFS